MERTAEQTMATTAATIEREYRFFSRTKEKSMVGSGTVLLMTPLMDSARYTRLALLHARLR